MASELVEMVMSFLGWRNPDLSLVRMLCRILGGAMGTARGGREAACMGGVLGGDVAVGAGLDMGPVLFGVESACMGESGDGEAGAEPGEGSLGPGEEMVRAAGVPGALGAARAGGRSGVDSARWVGCCGIFCGWRGVFSCSFVGVRKRGIGKGILVKNDVSRRDNAPGSEV